MKISRFVPVLVVSAFVMGNAYAASASPSTYYAVKGSSGSDQKECSKANGGSMTSKAYTECVKAKESAAAKPTTSERASSPADHRY